jgi:hypothetical protein
MGCTDERSVSNKPPKKRNHNFSNPDDNKKADKKGNINNQEKININEEEMKKNEQNSIKQIQFNNEENNNNNININLNNDEDNDNDNSDDDDNNNNEDEGNNEDDEDKSGTESDEEDEIDSDVPEINRDIYREIAPYLQSKVNPNFNFPELKEEIYVGLGLRRMKAFKSPVTKEELKQRREAFWGTRIEGDAGVWQFLKELCELPINEDENIKPMLEANEITPLKNCLNVTFDRGGEVYEIPNYCINEPYTYDLPESHLKRPEKKKISFHGRKGGEQFKIKTENYTKIDSIRKNVGKKFEKEPNLIRLFFRGKEMKDGNELWQYNVQDDDVIIIMCSG